MGEEKFKNYCIIVLGRVDGVIDEISEITDFDVNFLEHTNVVVATFSTDFKISKIKKHFDSYNRGYFLFELGIDNYAVNVGDTNNAIYNQLFKQFENGGDISGNIETKDFLDKLAGKPPINITDITDITEIKGEEVDIDSLTSDERKEMVNEIIDKGVENFTKKDKELLTKLTNYDN